MVWKKKMEEKQGKRKICKSFGKKLKKKKWNRIGSLSYNVKGKMLKCVQDNGILFGLKVNILAKDTNLFSNGKE